MGDDFRFVCPSCGRKFKSNKDLAGRLKRCGQCRGTFMIGRVGPPRKEAARTHHHETAVLKADPELPIDEAFSALSEWQRSVDSLPGSFAREVTFGQFTPTYRLTLEVTTEDDRGRRAKSQSQRDTATLPQELGVEAVRAARKVGDIPFDHTSELADKLSTKPDEVRRLAELLAKELRPPEGGRFAERRLKVEHLPVWRASWRFGDRDGDVWFYGRPLRVHLPDPPRRSSLPVVAAVLLILGGVGAGAWLVRDLMIKEPPPAVAPAPPPPRPRPEPIRFAKDGVIQLDDGGFLRGAFERKDDSVVVQATGSTETVPTWRIEGMHVDAPIFMRGETRRLDELESRVKAAKPQTPRETLVALFLEVHRQRDRWARLESLCSASELSPEPGPRKRLEALQGEVQKLLEKPEPVAVAPANPAPEPAPKPPELPPAVGMAAELLRQMSETADAEARRRLALSFNAVRGEKLPQADLLHFAHLYLLRGDFDAGLAVDRVHVKTGQVDSTFDGSLEKRGEYHVILKTPAGQEVSAFRDKETWTAHLPGGMRVDGAQCTATPAARTPSGELLRAFFDRLPPARWMSAPAGEHLRAGKAAADAVERRLPPADRGRHLLRYLAAGHLVTALQTGTPAEILEARAALHGMGYTPTSEGRWERAEDRRAAQLGQLAKDGRADEARSMLPVPRTPQDFFGHYRSTAIQIQAPMRKVEDFDRAVGSLEQSIGLARTASESRHLLALRNAVSGFGVCASCGGNASRLCTTCRGKGQRLEACAPCGGVGFIVQVGIGAKGMKTCDSCQGKPIRGSRPCEKCDGKGSRSCPKCQGVTKIPGAADLSKVVTCGRCAGTGGHGERILFSCPSCAGMGSQLQPAGVADATLQ